MNRDEVVAVLAKTDFVQFKIALAVANGEVLLVSKKRIPNDSPLSNLLGVSDSYEDGVCVKSFKLSSLNAFVLRFALPKSGIKVSSGTAKILGEYADKVPLPSAVMGTDEKSAFVTVPRIDLYKDIMTRVGAYAKDSGYRLRINKLIELEIIQDNWHSRFPKIVLSRELQAINNAPIIGFDGSVDSLKEIPIGALNIVQANIQARKSLSNSKATLEEKLAKFGISTLHDLLFRLPKKYIDKSKPQLVSDLVPGEKATVIGKISAMRELNAKVPGLAIIVEDSTGNEIRATFWRQVWLKTKFKVGQEVILNGTASLWNNTLQLGGDSIEHFDEGATLPVVPIYRQSGVNGITSAFQLAAVRELLKRMGELSLPVYFKNKEREGLSEILEQLHFPSNLTEHEKAVLAMAYYEIVYLQLVILSERDAITGKPGVAVSQGERKLQIEAARSLPFKLTEAQRLAVTAMNKKMNEPVPSSTLLLADVGSGKTLAAQLSCLRAVDAGYQAVLVSPTDVLARQLYANTLKLVEGLKKQAGHEVTVGLLVGGLKAAEKKELLKAIAAGTVDIIVGTQAVFSDGVKYANLGLAVIDEQQKFGAEQRTKLLEARDDGRVPHLLMQTATPIPRTTAQVYYGDIDIITMDGKPPGRTPIVTEWIQDDPQELVADAQHPVWRDVLAEVKLGNQAFVIAPMVVDSDKVDAASVEHAYKALSSSTLKSARVGYVHGSQKAELQRETMRQFRDGELDVLVASTVIEVGVDIPNATRMVILSADRLGASSLHQIRGRVGRSSKASKCYLVAVPKSAASEKRLQALVDSEDGFEIAKVDLEIRGEGTMFSSSQSGRSDMIFATIASHSGLIENAKEEAKLILKTPFKAQAIRDAKLKYDSPERLF